MKISFKLLHKYSGDVILPPAPFSLLDTKIPESSKVPEIDEDDVEGDIKSKFNIYNGIETVAPLRFKKQKVDAITEQVHDFVKKIEDSTLY